MPKPAKSKRSSDVTSGDVSINITDSIAFNKRKCASIKHQLMSLNKRLTTERVSELDEAELLVHIEHVNNMHETFDQVQSTVEEADPRELDGTVRAEFFDVYLEVKAKLSRQLNMHRKSNVKLSSTAKHFDELTSTPHSSLRKSRLPELKIPTFNGAYIDWPNYFAMFSSVIDKDLELSKVEKLQHLRASLQGAALDTICSLEPVEENYEKAVDLLKKRFDNKLLIFQAHMKAIFGLKTVDRGSATGLRELSDKFNSHFRALNTLATPEQISDGLLIYLITRKFDQKTQEKWEEELPIQTLPTLNSMTSFLEKHCRLRENLENAKVPQTPSNQVGKNSNVNKSVKNVLVASSSTSVCVFCESKDHHINSCLKFLNLSPNLRYKEAKRLQLCLNCLRKGHSLQRCKSGHCRHCAAKHNSLLNMNPLPTSTALASNRPEGETTSSSQQTLISSLASTSAPQAPKSLSNNNVLLATAILLIKDRSGNLVPCRAILDSASQINFVTTRLANLLQLPFKKSTILISGIGESNFVANKEIDVFAQSQDKSYQTSFTAVVTPSITDYQPTCNFSSEWKVPQNIKLADPLFFKPQRIDLLIGADLFFDLMCVGQIRIASNLPILQKTRLGWVVAGGVSPNNKQSSLIAAFSHEPLKQQQNDKLNDIVKRFWEIENCFDCAPSPSEEDDWCEQHFKENVIRLATGEYAVRLPATTNFSSLGDSYDRALRRFKTLERKLAKDDNLKNQYTSFMREYSSLNHMSLANPQAKVTTFFLPHHGVHKLDSTTTKLRVVFDGSAKTTTGLSLNDLLLAGPTIQPKLFKTLLQFRLHKFAICGDICKMYRCVRMASPDEYLQCILWREHPHDEITIYKLDTVTYGTKPAAFLAIRSMHQLSYDEEKSFPIGAKIVRRDFYVDDLISGGDTIEEVVEIRDQVKGLLQRGGFNIRKWCSNEAGVLQGFESECENLLSFHDGTDVTKTLGLVWDPKSDNFLFALSPIDHGARTTKRAVLSYIAKFYDPLGLASPVIAKAKIFLQLLWKQKLQWDESLPQSLQTAWNDICAQFSLVISFKFPRYAIIPHSRFEIHAFCDASILAFGACVYIRSDHNGFYKSCLLCAKSRVAPLKSLTIPKLELSAALLLAELVASISKDFPHPHSVHCWSDSMVALSWLREQPSNFNAFVSNRVSQIQTLTKGMTWHHVPTSLNPADILSRGCTPKELLSSKLWSHGPPFLLKDRSYWPNNTDFLIDLPERRRNVLVTSQLRDITLDCKYHNSFDKLQRVFAYIYFFSRPNRTPEDNKPLTPSNIKGGTYLLIRNIQQIYFAAELKALSFDKKLNSSSKLNSLNPFVDSLGLLRVGGRLQNSNMNFEAKHPLLLPKNHPVTKAIIDYFHHKYLHAGPQSVLASIRQQYWPIGGRKAVASVINKCVRCFRLKPKTYEHIMGMLPADRVQPSRAFLTSGVDFCGPFYYKSEVRNRPPIKCYICIFVCFSTKACHLELVRDLSTPSFLAALKRFICTRGKPHTIWSDNATNFVGAKNELLELRQLFLSNSHITEINNQCISDGIAWKFIPPRSPHFGGLWEAAVKSAKYHLLRTVGLSILTFEELRTLVCEIGAIINSRPLCPISENPDDLDVLTPAHFLIGASFTSFVEPDLTNLDISRLNRWQRICHLQQVFWKKWSCSYLSLLQERVKWRKSTGGIQVGNMVILKDENLPSLKWRLGRVDSLTHGSDGVVRVVIIRTANGLVKRSVRKVAVLPIETDVVERLNLPTGGECSQQH